MSIPSAHLLAVAAGAAHAARRGPVASLTRRSSARVSCGATASDEGATLPWALAARERAGTPVNLADAAGYKRLVERLAGGIIASATPASAETLFPGAPGVGGAEALGFAHGTAGVLWALCETGAHVPDALADWLVDATHRMPHAGAGLADGYAGLALTLDALGRSADAAWLWRAVEETPLDELGVTLADGLAGLGLALLERAPIPDAEALLAKVDEIAGALVERLAERPRLDRLGLSRGGAGVALFLLHMYDLTEDPALLRPIEDCLRHDLALLGWKSFGRHAALPLWTRPGSLENGSIGVAIVLRQAQQHLDAPWVAEAAEELTAAAERWLLAHPGLSHGRAGTVLALQYLRSHPWETPEERFVRVCPYLEPLTVHADARADAAAEMSMGLEDGVAGVLLALGHLGRAGERRVPFFW
ncbi:lanthionine synthetase LanC family protein [Georgenia sp. AZ-5]|uniref:lanthionine synthetase LanC family protein n=1 Tax=Georgenia sp. AZ-5 TaxID=3367526 RepID=UPI0037547B76